MDGKKETLSSDEQAAEKFSVESHYRDKLGRFVVIVPLQPNLTLVDPRTTALRCLHQLERRLYKDTSLRKAYTQFMHEEQQAGHMLLAYRTPKGMSYYKPFHPAPEKPLIVDGASRITTNGLSLNDTQTAGPKLQFDLNDQVMRIRRHLIASAADIMIKYKQVGFDPSQWDLMRSTTAKIRTTRHGINGRQQ